MRLLSKLYLLFILSFAIATPLAQQLKPVASIAPVHSWLLSVVGDDDGALLLLPPEASPHNPTLTPSQIRHLRKASALFYVHKDMEIFMQKILPTLPSSVHTVQLADSIKLIELTEAHDHDDHDSHDDHEKHDSHGHDHDHDDHGHDKHDDHDDHGDYDSHSVDLHIWLDPIYAAQMGERMAKVLAEINPAQKQTYTQNAAKFRQQMTALSDEIDTMLKPYRNTPYAVTHDAYGYFARRYHLQKPIVVGGTHRLVSAKDVARAKREMKEEGATCLLSDTPTPNAVLANPIGSRLQLGADFYAMMMRQIAHTFVDCLSQSS